MAHRTSRTRRVAAPGLHDELGTGAELVVTAPTTEGDPVVTFSRVGPGIDGLEILTNASGDRFGGGTSTQLCPGTVTVTGPLGCTEQPPVADGDAAMAEPVATGQIDDARGGR
ncbi:hypothetical protein [Cellulomonas hominis]